MMWFPPPRLQTDRDLHLGFGDLAFEILPEGVDAGAFVGRDGEDLDAFEALLEMDHVLVRLGEVDLVSHDAPGALGQLGRVEGDFFPEDLEVGDGVTAFAAGGIHHEHEEAAAHDVPEELMTETDIGVGSFDESRDVCQGATMERTKVHDAHHGLEGGEGIIGDLGLGGGELGEERRLACIGEADKSGIGNGSQLKVELALFSGNTGGVLARGLMG